MRYRQTHANWLGESLDEKKNFSGKAHPDIYFHPEDFFFSISNNSGSPSFLYLDITPDWLWVSGIKLLYLFCYFIPKSTPSIRARRGSSVMKANIHFSSPHTPGWRGLNVAWLRTQSRTLRYFMRPMSGVTDRRSPPFLPSFHTPGVVFLHPVKSFWRRYLWEHITWPSLLLIPFHFLFFHFFIHQKGDNHRRYQLIKYNIQKLN